MTWEGMDCKTRDWYSRIQITHTQRYFWEKICQISLTHNFLSPTEKTNKPNGNDIRKGIQICSLTRVTKKWKKDLPVVMADVPRGGNEFFPVRMFTAPMSEINSPTINKYLRLEILLDLGKTLVLRRFYLMQLDFNWSASETWPFFVMS